MIRFPLNAMIVAGLLGAVTAPAALQAQQAGQLPPAAGAEMAPQQGPQDQGRQAPRPMPDTERGPRHGKGPGASHAFGRGPHHGPMRPTGMDIAARLAATETYIGITQDQQDSWRAYAQAVIALLDSGPGHPGAPGMAATTPEAEPAAPAPTDDAAPAPLLGPERMAQGILARADKARALIDAATALRAELAPEQLDRLLAAEPGFGPGGPRGPHQGPDGGPNDKAPRPAR